MKLSNTIVEVLDEYLESENMSQLELAHLIQVAPATVSRWRSKKSDHISQKNWGRLKPLLEGYCNRKRLRAECSGFENRLGVDSYSLLTPESRAFGLLHHLCDDLSRQKYHRLVRDFLIERKLVEIECSAHILQGDEASELSNNEVLLPGQKMLLSYKVNNRCSREYTAWLGAELSGVFEKEVSPLHEMDWIYYNSCEDIEIQLKPGPNCHIREFTIPPETRHGVYRISGGVWIGEKSSGDRSVRLGYQCVPVRLRINKTPTRNSLFG